jgi:hypothetical protein
MQKVITNVRFWLVTMSVAVDGLVLVGGGSL